MLMAMRTTRTTEAPYRMVKMTVTGWSLVGKVSEQSYENCWRTGMLKTRSLLPWKMNLAGLTTQRPGLLAGQVAAGW